MVKINFLKYIFCDKNIFKVNNRSYLSKLLSDIDIEFGFWSNLCRLDDIPFSAVTLFNKCSCSSRLYW